MTHLIVCAMCLIQQSPLIHQGHVPRPQWMSEMADSTKPSICYVLSYAHILMIKFIIHLYIRHSKRLTITNNTKDDYNNIL